MKYLMIKKLNICYKKSIVGILVMVTTIIEIINIKIIKEKLKKI